MKRIRAASGTPPCITSEYPKHMQSNLFQVTSQYWSIGSAVFFIQHVVNLFFICSLARLSCPLCYFFSLAPNVMLGQGADMCLRDVIR